ncbi:TRP-domain-containing protein [Leucogyrophana mollusca]|uniref:TRP-domain-containing protein n=1 Tax=Leucogyrophana mollusca TaxID=85980 RepID=A0ACB8BNQ6_9AGAM|nr:TRP-domain-containing protein [Leucogyrophana mollusca]
MFFRVARLRHTVPLLLAFSPLVSARDESLFTSSVTYCAPATTLLIQQFDVAYFAKNSSIWFNISAASVDPNVNVSANIMLNVYGTHAVNFTIDLCSLFNGALCPLPMYNFTGSDSIPLPSSLGVTNKIPGIAYKIPDLEAYAQLSLNDVSTGELKACVQATLSNGWSAHQVAVEWATGALGLLALFSAIGYSLSTEGLAPYRLFDLFYLYQWAASTAFLDLNYSSVYRAFATNFSWAMGLFSASASSPIQLSINNMRHLTGGNMADATGGSAVALVNRKLSPYNAESSSSYAAPTSGIAGLGAESFFAFPNITSAKYVAPASLATVHDFSSAGQVQLVTASSSNVLEAGVPIYVNSVGIATANAFMTVFLVALMLAAILLAVLGVCYVGVILAGRHSQRKDDRYVEWRYRFPFFARAWLLRVCLVMFTPVTIFTLYQWTLKDSWLSILLSVILLLAVVGYLLYPIFLTVRLAIRSTPYALYTQTDHLNSHGPLYALYRTQRYFANIPLLVAILSKSIFIAFAQANGEVQVIFILLVECGVLASLLVLRPHRTRGADVLATYLAITRVVCTGLMIAFMESLNLAAIPRVAIGIVIAVIISIAVIVMFFNTLVNLGLMRLLPARLRRSSSPGSPTDASVLEKGGDASGHSGESHSPLGRPRNPTPERNVPLDPNVRQTYPSSPSQTTDHQSVYSEESGSTTLGSLLPRRWSFQPSQPSHSRSNSQSQPSPHSTNFLSTASSPRQSLPPSPLYSHSRSHSRQPTIDEHGPLPA